jgi:hypothetical protein
VTGWWFSPVSSTNKTDPWRKLISYTWPVTPKLTTLVPHPSQFYIYITLWMWCAFIFCMFWAPAKWYQRQSWIRWLSTSNFLLYFIIIFGIFYHLTRKNYLHFVWQSYCLFLRGRRGCDRMVVSTSNFLLYSKLAWIEVMVFNATFNNISVISWRSVLLVE